MNTPVLLITFNRPNHTRMVLNAIKRHQPKHMYIFQDGARIGNTEDELKCLAVRSVIQELLDWDCDLKTLYADYNLGCGPGPAKGITWFFEHVEQGIIIEDDAIPADDFFGYAEELLNYYNNDTHIRAIGSMKVDERRYGDASYYFSMMNRTLCVWATWKWAWNDFDYYLRNVSKKEFNKKLRYYGVTIREREYWDERLSDIQKDGMGDTSWDQQFWMSIWLNQGVGICPNTNLSSNIGFDSEGTHTRDENNIAADLRLESILPITHPKTYKIYRIADLRFHKLYFQPYEYGFSGLKRLPFRINKRVKRLLNHQGPWIKK